MCRARNLHVENLEGRLVIFNGIVTSQVIERIHLEEIRDRQRIKTVVFISGKHFRHFNLYDFLGCAEHEVNNFFFGATQTA